MSEYKDTGGYFSVSREHLFNDPDFMRKPFCKFRAVMYLAGLAAFADHKITVRSGKYSSVFEIKEGQVFVQVTALARIFGWTHKTTRHFISTCNERIISGQSISSFLTYQKGTTGTIISFNENNDLEICESSKGQSIGQSISAKKGKANISLYNLYKLIIKENRIYNTKGAASQLESDSLFPSVSAVESEEGEKRIKSKLGKSSLEKIKAYTDSFEEFWKLYPRKANMSKSQTYSRWKKLIEGGDASFQEIMAGLDRYVNYCRRCQTEERFVKMATTWLNQKGWELDYTIEPSAKEKNERERKLRQMYPDYGAVIHYDP